jgi:Zn-dependent protease with chaperone function
MAAPISFAVRRRSVLAAALVACVPFAARGQQPPPPAATMDMVNLASELLYSRELERARAKRALDMDRSKLRTARRAAQLLIEAAPSITPAAAGWSWQVDVETRDEPIAYCLPGGKVMLSTGLVDRMRLTPGEVAVLVSHAIAHALAGHDAKEAIARVGAMPESPDPNRRILQLMDALSKLVFATPHDIATEKAADSLALEYLARAGIDPEPTVEAWRKVARAGGTTPPAFLALHPMWSGRIEEIEAQVPAVLPLYEQAKAEQASRPRAPPVRTRPGAY